MSTIKIDQLPNSQKDPKKSKSKQVKSSSKPSTTLKAKPQIVFCKSLEQQDGTYLTPQTCAEVFELLCYEQEQKATQSQEDTKTTLHHVQPACEITLGADSNKQKIVQIQFSDGDHQAMDSNQSQGVHTAESPIDHHIMVSKNNLIEPKSPKIKAAFERKMTNQDVCSSQDMNSSNFGVITTHLRPKNLSKQDECTFSASSDKKKLEGDHQASFLQQKRL